MARRKVGGAEGRRLEKEIRRVKNVRNERAMLIIACEDSKSSVLYFKAIFKVLKSNRTITNTSLVIAKHRHTDPCGVLKDLLAHKGYKDFTHKWIVIDRDAERSKGDGHTEENFNNALARAKSKNVNVAYSNPCFEIWILLHFELQNASIDRKILNNRLEKDYQYKKNKLFSSVLNKNLQEKAIKNAQKLIKFWEDSNGSTNPTTDNPSTTVHELIAILNTKLDDNKD